MSSLYIWVMKYVTFYYYDYYPCFQGKNVSNHQGKMLI